MWKNGKGSESERGTFSAMSASVSVFLLDDTR